MTILHQKGAGSSNPRTALSWAASYAQAGARVLPLRPNQKVPGITDWPNKATTDPQQVQAWFQNGANNLGIAMGAWDKHDTYQVCIDLDVHEADKNGVQAWDRLVAEHGDMGSPFIADTATGGMHLLYQSSVALGNDKGALPDGIDVRGCGGQIMVQPSKHPTNGKSPQWRDNTNWGTDEPGTIPAWVVALIQTRPERAVQSVVPEYVKPLQNSGDTRPGDEYNRTHTWHQVLTADGWTDLGNGDWLRPGKTVADSCSANLNTDAGAHGVLVVFSTNAPQQLLHPEFATDKGDHHKVVSPWAYEVAMRHGGDFAQAARTYGQDLRRKDERALAQLVSSDKPTPTDTETPKADIGVSYRLQPLSGLIGVPHKPLVPVLLHYDNQERGLFYPDAHNLIAASSGSGKSWLQAITMHQQIVRGNHVVIIDYEMNMRTWFTRMQLLGATDAQLALVHYCAPDAPLQYKAQYGERVTQITQDILLEELHRINNAGNLTWVCIDGVTNAMTANSLQLMDNQDIALFWQLLPQAIVKHLPGIGVGLNDHVPKNAKGDTVLPIGGQHKVATTTGSAFTMRAVSQLAKYPTLHDGHYLLKLIKDRNGEVGLQQTEVAQIILTPSMRGPYTYQVLPYTGDAVQAANSERDKVLQAIDDCNQAKSKATQSQLIAMTGIKNKNTMKSHLEVLQNQGRVQNVGTETSQNWQVIATDIALTDSDLGLDF